MERTLSHPPTPRNPNPPNQRAVEQISRETWSTSQRCAHVGRNVGHRSQPLQRSNHDMERDTYTARTTASIWDKTRPTCNDQPQWRSCLLGEHQGWRVRGLGGGKPLDFQTSPSDLESKVSFLLFCGGFAGDASGQRWQTPEFENRVRKGSPFGVVVNCCSNPPRWFIFW